MASVESGGLLDGTNSWCIITGSLLNKINRPHSPEIWRNDLRFE